MRKILDLLNSILGFIGLRIVGVSKFERLVAKLVKQAKPIKFVQIGANDGVRFDSLYFTVTQNRWPGLVVEPLPDFFERLSSNYRDYPEVIPVNIAVHPTDPFATIYRVDQNRIGECPDWAAGIASFSPEHHMKSKIPSELIVSEVVKCRPLMEVIADYKMLDASLLQIDTEGFDAEVIKMINFSSFRPQLIKYENVNLSAKAAEETKSILASNGYRCYVCGNDTVASLI